MFFIQALISNLTLLAHASNLSVCLVANKNAHTWRAEFWQALSPCRPPKEQGFVSNQSFHIMSYHLYWTFIREIPGIHWHIYVHVFSHITFPATNFCALPGVSMVVSMGVGCKWFSLPQKMECICAIFNQHKQHVGQAYGFSCFRWWVRIEIYGSRKLCCQLMFDLSMWSCHGIYTFAIHGFDKYRPWKRRFIAGTLWTWRCFIEIKAIPVFYRWGVITNL